MPPRRPARRCRATLLRLAGAGLAAAALAACNGARTDPPVTAPGAPVSPGTAALGAGASVLQKKPPVDAIAAYLNGFHYYAAAPNVQMEAHHYCTILNDDVIQCVIYDGNTAAAQLMGVEYIVAKALFDGLPDAEKPLWHSHAHEVGSGQLIAPGLPLAAEHALMTRLAGTYGKTWHTWHTDRHHRLPLGEPQLMLGFTADGQLDAAMLAERDRRFGIDSAERRRTRADIVAPTPDPRADGGGMPAAPSSAPR